MKKTIFYSIIAFLGVIFYACNDEWKDEQYEKWVSFVRSGYVETYLNANAPDGVIHYKIPVEVSGSTQNDRTLTVTIEVDPDTLIAYNKAMYFTREDLYFRLLDEQHYSFPNGLQVTIPAGKDVGYLDVDFTIEDLDLVEKYVLPLKIASTSEYMPSPKKWYKRTLMRIIPFSYFSGTYSAGAATIKAEGNTETTTMATREMRVVSDSTVFFYAGLCEEDARDRATYKVRATFNADQTITFTADSTKIEFTPTDGKCTWTVKEEMDALQPYLIIRTVIMDLQYSYQDVSNPNYKVKYSLTGFYTLERRRNTQIPEEDQQEIFE
ncbi:MAG: hypothetical protein EZS26_000909 [Candidatus Ordinivivax streblomastigis]|uniref:DUF4973 domain-containing protein n=1 Tax=Candidatus Ordinivivax streblomastigis TaxID=2540710 RepID=A0A5M8P3P9_9BACT|nr:MAG: hypothetical protein EZS26_000909 [Candidatus Ordinivivax streblomastigis]